VKRLMKWLAVLAVLGGGAFALTMFARPAPLKVSVRKVERRTILDTVSGVATGVVEPTKRVSVQPETMARVKEVRVRRGDRVAAGDVLVTLDTTDIEEQVTALRAAIPVLEARVRQARARATQLDTERERAKRLFDAGSLPGQQMDNAKAGHDLSVLDGEAVGAAMRQARVNLDLASATLRKTEVKAPFAGVVLDVTAEVGETVGGLGLSGLGGGGASAAASSGVTGASAASLLASAGSSTQGRGVVDLADDTDMFVSVDADETDFWKVKAGQPATLTVDALGKKKLDGTVAEVYPYVSRALDQNRTVRIKVRLGDAARGAVLPGMSANVEIVASRRDGVLAIPTQCVLTRPAAKVVMKVDGEVLRETTVTTAVGNWEWTAIEGGVAEGDVVAVPPGDAKLEDGMKVVVRNGEH